MNRLIAEGDLTRAGGYEAARRLLSLCQPPTAIMGVNDLTAIGAMRAAHERGLVVGRDVAVAGYDGIEDGEHTHPPLTTLSGRFMTLARRLVNMLLTIIAGEPLAERQVMLPPELIVRGSTGGEPSRVRSEPQNERHIMSRPKLVARALTRAAPRPAQR
jgi:DNA-binding LacI/PurR family transcriptional regulator